jgi:hypothetical protein
MRRLGDLETAIGRILAQQEMMMTSMDEIMAALAAAKADFEAFQGAVTTAIDGLKATIAAVPPSPDLAPVLAAVQALDAEVNAAKAGIAPAA